MPASTTVASSSFEKTTGDADDDGDGFGSSIGLLAVDEEHELPRDSGDGDADEVDCSNFCVGGSTDLDTGGSSSLGDVEFKGTSGSGATGHLVSVATAAVASQSTDSSITLAGDSGKITSSFSTISSGSFSTDLAATNSS